MSEYPLCTVRPLSRERYLLVPAKGCTIAIFRQLDNSAEAVISTDAADETVRLRIEPPHDSAKVLAIYFRADGSVEVGDE